MAGFPHPHAMSPDTHSVCECVTASSPHTETTNYRLYRHCCVWAAGFQPDKRMLQNVRNRATAGEVIEIQYQPQNSHNLFFETYKWLKKWNLPSGNNVSLCLIISHFPPKIKTNGAVAVNHVCRSEAALELSCAGVGIDRLSPAHEGAVADLQKGSREGRRGQDWEAAAAQES